MNWRKSIRKRLRYKGRPVFSVLLAITLLITGIPFIPGADTGKARAATVLSVDPVRFAPVYDGVTDIQWEYNNPDTGQIKHSTDIDLCNGSGGIVKDTEYPTLTQNHYLWDGKINGTPVPEGKHKICVTPVDFPSERQSADIEIVNPNPPAPKLIRFSPQTEEISGVAEIGTAVSLYVTYTYRDGNNTTEGTRPEELLADNIPVSSTRTWSAAEPIEAAYFTDFPEKTSTGRTPDDFVGEWKVKVGLKDYEIAKITAVATRISDRKASLAKSEILQLLRFKALDWNVHWAYLAGYYYEEFEKERIVSRIESIAEYNGISLKMCADPVKSTQPCPGNINKDTVLYMLDPKQAGNLTREDAEYIEKAYANENGKPIAADLDPVNLATGDFSFHHTSLSLEAPMPLKFKLTYHSRDPYDGAVGVGWHHSWGWELQRREEGQMAVISPDGAAYVFHPLGNGEYRTPPGTYNRLTQLPDETYRLETPEHLTYLFRQDGLFITLTDANGNTAKLQYDGTMLEKVSTDGADLTFTYGDGAKLTRVTDQSGRYAEYRYDSVNHDLTAIVLPDGAVIGFEYDERHRMTGISNPNETSTLVNEYDDQGRVVRQRDFAGNWGEIRYDSVNRKTVVKDARGYEKTYEYDERQRRTAVHYPDGTSERFAYDSNDKMTSATDRNGNTTSFVYDERGNLLQAKDPLGGISHVAYNEWNKPKEVTDPLGNKTAFGYDAKGNLTAVTDALGHTSSIDVDARGIPTSITNANGETTQLVNDADGFAKSVLDPAGNRKELERDPLHRVTAVIDALRNSSKVEYDPRDRVKSRIDALGFKESFDYDKNSNLTSHTDASGSITAYEYDRFDRISAVIDPLGKRTEFRYDEAGNRTTVIDANGTATKYEYDNVNRVERIVLPKEHESDPEESIRFTYDGNGNILTREDPKGGKTTVVYDARNLPVSITDAAGAASHYEYDKLGRLTEETNALGHKTSYEYDALGRVIQVTDAMSQTTSFTYDKAGRLIETAKPNGAVCKLQYDARGLLAGMTDPLGNSTAMMRDALGRVTESTDEAGVKTIYAYDALGRVTSIVNALGHTTSFTYDPLGRVKQITDAKQQVTGYEYDRLGQLTKVVNALNNQTAYAYDAVGNILSKTDANGNTTRYSYNKRH
ncbi:MAG: hypothetical protein K0R28_2682, partial [Paenibacillus sp.]|nr:hypothetical protein [Paenibacillus sp.]